MPLVTGVKTWSLARAEDGHRTYKLKQEVRFECDEPGGLFAALNTPGIYLPGAEWDVEEDFDPYAFCQPDADVRALQEQDGEKPRFYTVEQTFSTKPKRLCLENPIEDPLLQPTKISGSIRGKKEEATYDRFGRPVVTSSWEQIRGKENEWDWVTATVEVEQNVALLELALCTSMVNRVNGIEMWGLPARCIKLSSFTWEQKYYGHCYIYYMRKFSFEIDFRGWDRNLADEGTKVLRGKWEKPASGRRPPTYLVLNNPNVKNPGDFVRYTDPYGHPGKVQLNGHGLPAGVCIDWGETDSIPPIPSLYYVRWQNTTGLTTPHLNDPDWQLITDKEPPILTVPATWNNSVRYRAGNLVTYLGEIFVAISDPEWGEPPIITDESSTAESNWVFLGGIVFRGEYDDVGDYAVGDLVNTPEISVQPLTGTADAICNQMPPAKIHVEKYNNGNLLLLGVPLIF